MIHVRYLLMLAFLFTTVTVSAQEIAQTETGKKVRLNPDGTWVLLEADTVSGFNPNAAKFYVGKLTKPTRLKGLVELRDQAAASYSSFQSEADQYYSFAIACDGLPKNILAMIGNIKKATPDGERLFEALSDGRKHKVVLEVRFRTKTEQKPYLARVYGADAPFDMLYDKNQVLITKVVAIDTWEDQ